MTACTIDDTKDFMNKLLLQPVFYDFCLVEASITTFRTVHIDGRLRTDFYSSEELENLSLTKLPFSYWKDNQHFCLELIKGKKSPLSFKITLTLSPDIIAEFLSKHALSIQPEDVKGLILNIKYSGDKVTCITGTSLSFFTTDKSLDLEWDRCIAQFFKDKQIISTLLS